MSLRLTPEEIAELFNRCLSSSLEDTDVSVEAMRKLADALAESSSHLRLAG